MPLSPLHCCPSPPHWPCHHVFPISLALCLSLRLSCCAVMRWIEPWHGSRFYRLIDTRVPWRERPAGWCAALLKELFYPGEWWDETREEDRKLMEKSPKNIPIQIEQCGRTNWWQWLIEHCVKCDSARNCGCLILRQVIKSKNNQFSEWKKCLPRICEGLITGLIKWVTELHCIGYTTVWYKR